MPSAAYKCLFILVTLCKEVLLDTTSEIWGDQILASWTFYENGPYGGTQGGVWFTDFYQSLDGRVIRPKHWPDGINVRSGGRIDAIQVFYGPYKGQYHGGNGGELHKIRLYQSDRINRISGRRGMGPGAGVDQLTFHTSSGKTFGPYGGGGGFSFEARPPDEKCGLAFISGRADLRLDSITFHWRCPKRWQPFEPNQENEGQNVISDSDHVHELPFKSSSESRPKLRVVLIMLATIFLMKLN